MMMLMAIGVIMLVLGIFGLRLCKKCGKTTKAMESVSSPLISEVEKEEDMPTTNLKELKTDQWYDWKLYMLLGAAKEGKLNRCIHFTPSCPQLSKSKKDLFSAVLCKTCMKEFGLSLPVGKKK